jgi:drug/metabolite transporter (DMT)-like permease
VRAFLLAGCGFGLALAICGVLVLVHGREYEHDSSGVARGDVGTTGILLVAIGLIAIGLTAYLVIAKRRGRSRTQKATRRKG